MNGVVHYDEAKQLSKLLGLVQDHTILSWPCFQLFILHARARTTQHARVQIWMHAFTYAHECAISQKITNYPVRILKMIFVNSVVK